VGLDDRIGQSRFCSSRVKPRERRKKNNHPYLNSLRATLLSLVRSGPLLMRLLVLYGSGTA
jgi:hypothetical protein